MAPFCKSSESPSKDDKITDSSGNSAGDRSGTPTNTPSGGSQTHLTKGLKAAVAKGLEDQKSHPEKGLGEVVQDVMAGLDLPDGTTKDTQEPSEATEAAREGEGVVEDAGQVVEGLKYREGQGGRKSSVADYGRVKFNHLHDGRRAAVETKETQRGGEPANDGGV